MKKLTELLLVGSGCFLGAVLRYGVKFLFDGVSGDLSILVVNILGGFLIGLFSAKAFESKLSAKKAKFLTTGFCGGLTTFSSFASGIVNDFLTGHLLLAASYIVLNMILGLFFVYLGAKLILKERFKEFILQK